MLQLVQLRGEMCIAQPIKLVELKELKKFRILVTMKCKKTNIGHHIYIYSNKILYILNTHLRHPHHIYIRLILLCFYLF
jgi:hypothetical protein